MISAADAQLVGCPLPASVVASTESMRRRVALSRSIPNVACSVASMMIQVSFDIWMPKGGLPTRNLFIDDVVER